MGSVVSFLRRAISRDWSTQELAEFYRVEAALVQSGLHVVSERGVTDEGDPWFVFCRVDDDEVIVHFARISGRYLISAPSYGDDVVGYDFQALVRGLVERQPTVQPPRQNGKVIWHPSALLVMLVASALLKTGHPAEASQARSAEPGAVASDRVPVRAKDDAAEHTADVMSQEVQQNTAILAAVALVSGPLDLTSIPTMVVSAHVHEPAPPVHVTHALGLGFSSDLDANGHLAGAGSVAAAPTAQDGSLPLLSLDDVSQGHNLASWQMLATPIAGGVALNVDAAAVSTALGSAVGLNVPVAPAADPLGVSILHEGFSPTGHDLAESLLNAFNGTELIFYTNTVPVALNAPLQASTHSAAEGSDLLTSSASLTLALHATAPVSAPASVVTGITNATLDNASPGVPAIGSSTQALAESSLPAVIAVMQNFAKEVGPNLVVLVTGNQVIEYDQYAIDHTPAAVSAVTYDFADGSHISLVGLPAEILHAQA